MINLQLCPPRAGRLARWVLLKGQICTKRDVSLSTGDNSIGILCFKIFIVPPPQHPVWITKVGSPISERRYDNEKPLLEFSSWVRTPMERLKFLDSFSGHREQVSIMLAQPLSSLWHQPWVESLSRNRFLPDFYHEANLKKRKKKSCQDAPPPLPTCWKTKLHLARLLSKMCDFSSEHTGGRGLLTNPSVLFRSTACRW